jgi:hypothetical protein
MIGTHRNGTTTSAQTAWTGIGLGATLQSQLGVRKGSTRGPWPAGLMGGEPRGGAETRCQSCAAWGAGGRYDTDKPVEHTR